VSTPAFSQDGVDGNTSGASCAGVGSGTGPPTVAKGMVFVAGGANSPFYKPGDPTIDSNVNCAPPPTTGGTGSSCTGVLNVYGKN